MNEEQYLENAIFPWLDMEEEWCPEDEEIERDHILARQEFLEDFEDLETYYDENDIPW